VLAPDASDPEATVWELDELWSVVLKKTNKAWIWLALCRKTRQVVAYAIGDRSEQTCRMRMAKPLQKRIGQDIATPIFGLPLRQSFQRSSIQQWGRKQVRQLMSSAGITRCANVWLVSFGKRSLSQNLS
jgi:hypothetical protein